jgi:hypothetical protein
MKPGDTFEGSDGKTYRYDGTAPNGQAIITPIDKSAPPYAMPMKNT